MTDPNGNVNQGISLSGGSSSSDVTTYTVNYSIAQNATPGTYYLTVTNPFGTSNQKSFYVYDPSASISGFSPPPPWTAGTSFPLTVTGSNFGSNPSVTVSGVDITSGSAYNSNSGGTSTQIYVTIDQSAPSQLATITVTPSDPSGCTGNCFSAPGSSGGQSTGAASANAQVTVAPPAITNINPQEINVGTQGVQITISGSGFGSSPTVNLPSGVTQTGIAFTTSTIVVTANVGYVTPTALAQFSVTASSVTSNQVSVMLNGPASTQVTADVIGTTTNNPNAQSRFVTYQVYNLDQTSAGAIPISEDISETGYSCSQPNPGNVQATCNGQYTTSSSGSLTDEWGMYTGYTPVSCGVNITDHWQWCAPSVPGSAPTGPNPGITFQTLTGFIHANATQINGYTNPPTPIPAGTVFKP